jgi:molecular chaperone Hsp33
MVLHRPERGLMAEGGKVDAVLPFSVEGRNVRGRMVRLEETINDILCAQPYPTAIAFLLAEAVCLTALLGTMLKEEGVMTLQVNSDGPVRLLFVDYTTAGHLRGYARFDEAAVARLGDVKLDRLVPQLLHAGTLSVTIDPEKAKERYQGIVGLEGASLSECLQAYFHQSEQLPTAIKLATDMVPGPDGERRWRGAALMLQPLPATVGTGYRDDTLFRSEAAEDDWRHSVVLLNSARSEELLDWTLMADRLLFRLYHEDGVRLFSPLPLTFRCRCTRERLADVLRRFTPEELDDMAEEGEIRARCDICGKEYSFEPDELTAEAHPHNHPGDPA